MVRLVASLGEDSQGAGCDGYGDGNGDGTGYGYGNGYGDGW